MVRGLRLGSSQPYDMTGSGGGGGRAVPGRHRALCLLSFVILLFVSHSFPFHPWLSLAHMRSQLPWWEPQTPVLLQSRGSVGTNGPGNKRLE